jgi:hypothetical protein
MKGHIDHNGHAVLEMRADELRTLFIAVDKLVEHHIVTAAELETLALDHEITANEQRRGRTLNLRACGELRQAAAGHRALKRDAEDIRRILRLLTTNPDVR